MTHSAANRARSLTVTTQRGGAIKARRLALGIKSVREFADATGIDREALGKAERGEGSGGTYDRAESWLDRLEAETGHDEPTPRGVVEDEHGGIVRIRLEGVFGATSAVVEAPADNPDALAAALDVLMRRMNEQRDTQ